MNAEVWSELDERCATFSGEMLLHVDKGQVLRIDLEPELVSSEPDHLNGAITLGQLWARLDRTFHERYVGKVTVVMYGGSVLSARPRERFVPKCRGGPGWGHRHRHSA